jgi:hypothetical protein
MALAPNTLYWGSDPDGMAFKTQRNFGDGKIFDDAGLFFVAKVMSDTRVEGEGVGDAQSPKIEQVGL